MSSSPMLLVMFSGIVDQDVEPAHFGHGVLDGRAGEALIPGVARDRGASAAHFHPAFGLVRILMLIKVCDGDAGALFREKKWRQPGRCRCRRSRQFCPSASPSP